MVSVALLLLLLAVRVESVALHDVSPGVEEQSKLERVKDEQSELPPDFVPCTPPTQRVVGGTTVKHGEIPWQVSLRYLGNPFCGGSLVHPKWVLSAGHCFKSLPAGETYAALGEYRLNRLDGTEQIIPVVNTVVFPYYDPWGDVADENLTRNDHDLIMLKLRYPARLTDYVKVVDIPDPLERFNGSCCTVSGWGLTEYGGTSSMILKKFDAPVVTSRECGRTHRPGRIKDFHICSGYLGVPSHDACQGDSGGPMSCRKDGRNYVAGIVSWGIRCASGEAYGVYTRVSRYKSWIEHVIATQ